MIDMPSINKNDRASDRANGGKGDQHRHTKKGLENYRKSPIWEKLGTKFNKPDPQQEFDFHFDKP